MDHSDTHIIYKIVNTVTQKVYIGKTGRPLEVRFKEHLKHAKKTNGGRYSRLYCSMRKHGSDKFTIEPILTVIAAGVTDANHLESLMICEYNSMEPERGYNMTSGGDGIPRGTRQRGTRLSKETRLRMSAAHKGKPKSAEHRRNIGLAQIGNTRIITPEHRERISQASKGKKRGTYKGTARALNIGIGNRGKKRSPAHLEAMAIGRRRAMEARKLRRIDDDQEKTVLV